MVQALGFFAPEHLNKRTTTGYFWNAAGFITTHMTPVLSGVSFTDRTQEAGIHDGNLRDNYVDTDKRIHGSTVPGYRYLQSEAYGARQWLASPTATPTSRLRLASPAATLTTRLRLASSTATHTSIRPNPDAASTPRLISQLQEIRNMSIYGMGVRNGVNMPTAQWTQQQQWLDQARAEPPIYGQPGHKDALKTDHGKELNKRPEY